MLQASLPTRLWPENSGYLQSVTRGCKPTPLGRGVLEYLKHWSYETLEKEVQPNLDYRQLTRIGERPGRQDDGTLGDGGGAEGNPADT
jgi:hypothetical protein